MGACAVTIDLSFAFRDYGSCCPHLNMHLLAYVSTSCPMLVTMTVRIVARWQVNEQIAEVGVPSLCRVYKVSHQLLAPRRCNFAVRTSLH
jgi:hypothetical protein